MSLAPDASGTFASGGYPSELQGQRVLFLLLAYRLLLGSLLFALLYSDFQKIMDSSNHPVLLLFSSFGYLSLTLVSGIILISRWFSAPTQALTMFLVDAICIPLLIASGTSYADTLGILLASSIALTSLLLRGNLIYFLAAMATLSLFASTYYQSNLPGFDSRDISYAGILGMAYFAIALLANVLGRRVHESEALAKRHALEAADLARLNEQIIQQMGVGILVCNKDGRISYINHAARQLLEISGNNPVLIGQAHAELGRLSSRWLDDRLASGQHSLETPHYQLQVEFRYSGRGSSSLLVFLKDASEAMREARQIKLASLGRLTAGIAHQIRNPLSSIHHAGQLLDEAEALDMADRRLINIIQSNVSRVNKIIESILELSRRQEPKTEPVRLKHWLERFIEIFVKEHDIEAEQLQLVVQECPKEPHVLFDATQFEQILGNLCDNALHHGERGKAIRIKLVLGCNSQGHYWLQVQDNGQGMPEFTREHLFEPFYTTRSDGTGLGLYIARELAEANNIFLEALPSAEGMVFQLTFRGT